MGCYPTVVFLYCFCGNNPNCTTQINYANWCQQWIICSPRCCCKIVFFSAQGLLLFGHSRRVGWRNWSCFWLNNFIWFTLISVSVRLLLRYLIYLFIFFNRRISRRSARRWVSIETRARIGNRECEKEQCDAVLCLIDCREEMYPCTRMYSVHQPTKTCLHSMCIYRYITHTYTVHLSFKHSSRMT